MKKKIIKILLITIFLVFVFNVIRVSAIVNINENEFKLDEYSINTMPNSNYTSIYIIIAYILNLGCVLSIIIPIIIFIITLIKKYDWKIFKRTLLLAIFLFISSYIPKTMVSLGGGFENVRRIEPIEILFYITTIILELVIIIYPIYAIRKLKKQNSLKGENKNV